MKRWIASTEGVKLSLKDANALITSLSSVIHGACITDGYEIRLMKFGTFKAKITPESQRRNLKTGETFLHPETIKLHFKPHSKETKETEPEK